MANLYQVWDVTRKQYAFLTQDMVKGVTESKKGAMPSQTHLHIQGGAIITVDCPMDEAVSTLFKGWNIIKPKGMGKK